MKILIVENEPANLEVLTLAMEMEGFEVISLVNAKGFIPSVIAIEPDAVLLDIDLDGFDGRELCRQLKETEGILDTPVIVVSALSEEKVQSSLTYGADVAISKPFDLRHLTQTVRNLLEK
jgi:DNA-binding response OmpR family regulator